MNYRLLIAVDVSDAQYPRGHQHDPRDVAHDALGDHPEDDGYTLVDAVWVTPDTEISPANLPLGHAPESDEMGPSGP